MVEGVEARFLASHVITLRPIHARNPGLTRFRQKSAPYANNLSESSRRQYTWSSLLQARGFIPIEMRVISAKKEALQALSISKNIAWDALTFHFEEIEKSINCTRDTPMNQRIR